MDLEQIAFHAADPMAMRESLYRRFGMKEWVMDEVTGVAEIFGEERSTPIHAHLMFNHDMPVEYEIINAEGSTCWHYIRDKDKQQMNFLSHMACHVPNIVAALEHLPYPIAQTMVTFNHTNAYLVRENRTYIYVVLDTVNIFGFDLKLIQRINKSKTHHEETARQVLFELHHLIYTQKGY